MWLMIDTDIFGRPVFENRNVIDVEYEDLSDTIDNEPCYV